MSTRSERDGDASRPLVSVIVPTYDRNDELQDAVATVRDQTYGNVELIIVDDGSPVPVAETTDVPEGRFASVRFVRHETNQGANVARNTGIRASAGDLVAFLDDDDRWRAEKLRRQVETFRAADPEVGVVYTGTESSGERGRTTFSPSVAGNVVKDLLTGASFGQFSSVMVRSDVIADTGLPDERFPAWQDREWFLRLAKHCHFEPIDAPLTQRRIGLDDRITKNFEAKRDVAYPLFVEKHYSFAREFGLYYARSFLAHLRMNLAWSALQTEQYAEARKYFWLAFLANPLFRDTYPHLLPSLGGRLTYEPAAALRRKCANLWASVNAT